MIGRTRIAPALQDALAAVAGVTVAGIVVVGRALVFFATAKGRWGKCVGLDPPMNLQALGLLFGVAVLVCCAVHVLFTQLPALGAPALKGTRSAAVGLVAAAVVAWLLAAGYWEGT
jgi:hypothetical protein